jgi:uncharacterized RDD family membrane protein YckC
MFTKKLPVYIAIFCVVASIWGLYNNLYYTAGTTNRYIIKDAFRLVNFGVIFSRGFLGYNGINYANAVFEALLLLGSLFYLTSSGREARLFRAALGVIFLSSLLGICIDIVFLIFVHHPVPQTSTATLISILFILKYTILLYITQRVLRYFNQIKEFEVEVHEHNGSTLSYSQIATKGQRVTHALLDGLITFFVFSPFVENILFYLSGYSISISYSLGKPALLAIFIICRIIYYIVFEITFTATPAKMMTETRVVDSDGNQASPVRIFGRTMARLIPFEGFSFLVNSGWHDRLSGTNVVQEKATGKAGGIYYLIPPVIIVLIVGYVSIKTQITEHRIVNDYQAENQRFENELQRKLKQAGTNVFFTLERINKWGSDGNGLKTGKFLKVEQAKSDSINFTIVNAYGTIFDPPGQMEAEAAYKTGHDTLTHITLARHDLQSALLKNHQDYHSDDSTVRGFKIDGTLYAIKTIDTFFQPNIGLSKTFGYGNNYLNIGLDNTGWPANIVKVDLLQGEGKLKSVLPIPIRASLNQNSSKFIEATVDGDDIDFKVNITVQDTIGRTQVYQITGNSKERSSRTITRIK